MSNADRLDRHFQILRMQTVPDELNLTSGE